MSQYRLILSAGSLLAAMLLAAAAAIVTAAHTAAADSGALLRLKPAKHDFGQVAVTHSSSPLVVTVTNKSKTDPVAFTSIVAAEPFSIQSDKCSGSPLAAGSSCKLEVVFSPTAAGKVNGNKGVTFTDSAQDSPQQLDLEGQGILGSFF
jgi:hypothetical protein